MRKLENVENLLRFLLAGQVGGTTVKRLLGAFGTSERALGASAAEITAQVNLPPKTLAAVLAAREIDPRPELDAVTSAGAGIMAYDDPLYPAALLETADPPYLLYYKGALTPADAQAVGVVGTRQASAYGREQAKLFGYNLAKSGFSVVSGLARGVDTFAHRGAIDAGGRTLAVLGCGLNELYPPENRDLAAEICQHGAVLSEFTMGQKPARTTFPRRNRIIAGLSLGILVVEAPERSGALITARQAGEYGREVFAVPGRVDQSMAAGCHRLLREGAILARHAADIAQELTQRQASLPFAAAAAQEPPANSVPAAVVAGAPAAAREERLRKILNALAEPQTHIDDICREVALPPQEVSAALMLLEVSGAVRREPGQRYSAV